MPKSTKVQCPKCKDYMTRKQYEKHAKICRGDDPPVATDDESDYEILDAVEIGSDDDPEFYHRQNEGEMRPSYTDAELNELFEQTARPGFKGKRIGEDAKWARLKRDKKRTAPEMGMEYVKMVAGSNLSRDLRRRPHFMAPNAFDEWQKVHDKKKRYFAEETDVDGDEIDDFVVSKNRRVYDKGSKKWVIEVDENGNPVRDLIAVNGWTTVKSDYDDRKQFYDAYPTAKARKGKSFTKFIHSKYYTEDDQDEFGYPTHAYIEKRKEKMYNDGYKKKIRMPLPTARQDFMKMVGAAYKAAVTDLIKQHPEIERKNVSVEAGFIPKIGNKFWRGWIIETLFEEIRETEYYKELLDKYIARFDRAKFNKDKGITFNIRNPEHREKFEKTLLKNDSVRMGINSLVQQLLDEKGPFFAESFEHLKYIFAKELIVDNQ